MRHSRITRVSTTSAAALAITALVFGNPLGAVSISAAGRSVRAEPVTADRVLDGAIERMGGRDALEKITRARFDQIIQWLTMRFDGVPHADAPLYNWTSDLRDYTANARRVTLHVSSGFPSGGTWPQAVNVTSDSFAIQRVAENRPWTPLHISYVDEQHEDFATAPERLLLALCSVSDLRLGADTSIGGQRLWRVSGSVPNLSKHPVELFVNQMDSAMAFVRYHSVERNDALLVTLGNMEVGRWWSRWQSVPVGDGKSVSYPAQLDGFIGR